VVLTQIQSHQSNKMSRKGKQRGVDIKPEDALQAVVRKTLIG
jgi:hypothetical protein